MTVNKGGRPPIVKPFIEETLTTEPVTLTQLYNRMIENGMICDKPGVFRALDEMYQECKIGKIGKQYYKYTDRDLEWEVLAQLYTNLERVKILPEYPRRMFWHALLLALEEPTLVQRRALVVYELEDIDVVNMPGTDETVLDYIKKNVKRYAGEVEAVKSLTEFDHLERDKDEHEE